MEGFKQNSLDEEVIDEGKGILLRHKTLYHGSSVPGISKFNIAEETTVGEGVYFTSKSEDAQGYAIRRSESRKNGEPIIYHAEIENLKFIDLRNENNLKDILKGFLEILKTQRKNEEMSWVREMSINEAIEKIQTDKINTGNLKRVAENIGKLFTDYIKSIGYDGLITLEGGEGDDVGNHETYLVFDPKKIKKISIAHL